MASARCAPALALWLAAAIGCGPAAPGPEPPAPEAPPALLDEGLARARAGDRDGASALFETACLEGRPAGCYLFERQLPLPLAAGAPLPAEHEQACRQGSARSCFMLGAWLDGRDPIRAFSSFRRACQGGHAYACHREAELHRASARAPDAPMRALRLNMRACEAGFASPCAAAAEMLDGDDTALAHTPRGLRERACIRGHLPACRALAEAAQPVAVFACDRCPDDDEPRCVDCEMWRRYEAACCETCPERDRHAACADMQHVPRHPAVSPPPDPAARARADAEIRRVMAIAATLLEPLCDAEVAVACADLADLLSEATWPSHDPARAAALRDRAARLEAERCRRGEPGAC